MNQTQKILTGLLLIGVIGFGVFSYLSRPLPEASVVTESTTDQTDSKPGEIIFVASSGSSATYEIDETLNGKPKHVVGTTNDVHGQVFFNTQDPKMSRVDTFKINARTLKTDSERQDNTVGRIVLKSAEAANEYIVFEPAPFERIEISEGDDVFSFTLPGKLTVAGVTQPVVFEGTAKFVDSKLQATARATVTYADFGIEIPSLPFLAWVDNKTTITLNFVGLAR